MRYLSLGHMLKKLTNMTDQQIWHLDKQVKVLEKHMGAKDVEEGDGAVRKKKLERT